MVKFNRFLQTRTFKFLLTGVGVSGICASYYGIADESWHALTFRDSFPPKRRTELYVTGKTSDKCATKYSSCIDYWLFLLYTLYRIALLVAQAIPVGWYCFLTYGLGLCPDDVLFYHIVDFLTNMGPSYMKLGQWMATRPDIFPPELCFKLEKLYDDTEPHSWNHTESVLKKTYITDNVYEEADRIRGRTALDFLTDVQKLPLNSGSIAQIHRAKLKHDIDGLPAGTDVVIKVTHPKIVQTMAADIHAMKLIVKLINTLIPDSYLFNLKTSLNEFEALVSSQLDLRIESDNLIQFRYNFRHFPGVIFPIPVPSLATPDLLIETFEEGVPLTNLECSDHNKDIADIGCHMFMKMLFEDNFVHSDLHPGNILLRTNSNSTFMQYYLDGKPKRKRELVILDAGLVTTLSSRERNNFISLFGAVACGEGELGADLMIQRFPSIENDQSSSLYSMSNINVDKFRKDMKRIFDLVAPDKAGFKLSEIKIGEVLASIMGVIRENKAPLDGNFASLVLTVIVGEGLGRKLTPDFNLFAEASPYLISYLEGSELYFLSRKLKDTYGTQGLLKESSQLFGLEKIITFARATSIKVASTIHWALSPVLER